MLSSLRSFERQRAMSFEKNILSDPTSDGNVSTNGQVSERPSSSVYSYEAFDSTTPVNFVSDQENFTQTCPTCGGSGKLTKEQEHDLVALIPVRDRRLKPRRTILYLVLAVFLCLAICAVVGVIFFPRTVSIKLVGASPKNISIPSSNYSNPVIIINSTILVNNSNFFEASLDHINIQVNWNGYVVANPDILGKIKVPARSSLHHTFIVETMYRGKEADKIKRVCCGWSYNLAFLITVTAKTHSLTSSSEASDTQLEFVNCELNGIKWRKTCSPKG